MLSRMPSNSFLRIETEMPNQNHFFFGVLLGMIQNRQSSTSWIN